MDVQCNGRLEQIDSPHKRVVFNGATSNRFTCKTYGEKGIAGKVFSTGKQPLAPLELIFFFFYGMLSILHIGVAKGLP